MFRTLKNEARITFNMKVDSPLCIRSGGTGGIDPSIPDMSCIRSYKNGENTIFIPGSSIKGVMRSRCEKIIGLLGGRVCNIVDRRNACTKDNSCTTGEDVYKKMCAACKMFGSLSLAGRVKFKDAYPVGEAKTGFRNGVGINRITGAAQKGALYDFEVVEDATFKVEIVLTNYELYQLKLVLYTINDINEGYTSFGSSSTRGNGKMLVEDLSIQFRDYRKNVKNLTGYYDDDKVSKPSLDKELFYKVGTCCGIEESLELLDDVDVEAAFRR